MLGLWMVVIGGLIATFVLNVLIWVTERSARVKAEHEELEAVRRFTSSFGGADFLAGYLMAALYAVGSPLTVFLVFLATGSVPSFPDVAGTWRAATLEAVFVVLVGWPLIKWRHPERSWRWSALGAGAVYSALVLCQLGFALAVSTGG